MKQVLLLALAAFSVARLGVAASCVGGTLSGYVALGSSGCTIGGSTLSNFSVLSGVAFSTPISPMAITITPTGGLYNPGLTISTNQTANSGSLLEIIFAYQISGQMYIGTSALLGGSSESGGGGVTGIENYCAGGAFLGADHVSGCNGTNGALVTDDGMLQGDMGAFGKVSFVNVASDFTFDSGIGGTASGGTFNNSFTAVPEPVSSALAGLGLALAIAFRLRSKRAEQQIDKEEN